MGSGYYFNFLTKFLKVCYTHCINRIKYFFLIKRGGGKGPDETRQPAVMQWCQFPRSISEDEEKHTYRIKPRQEVFFHV